MNTLKINFSQQPLSLKEMAVSSIKNAIFEGQLEPETIYSDLHLANTLGISKTPVREALIELASNELLVHMPRKGFKIRLLCQKDIIDLFEYRMVIELSIINMVVPNITDEGQHQLGEILAGNKNQLQQNSEYNQSIKADRLFHLKLSELSNNPFFRKAIRQVRELCDLAGTWSLINVERKFEAQNEHEKILEMIMSRDVEGAKEKMKEHLSITCSKILENLQQSEE